MTKSFNKPKKNMFWANFWSIFPNFEAIFFSSENLAIMHNFIWVSCTTAKIQKKLMIQFRENAWTEGWTKGWKGRKMGRTYFIGPFELLSGVQKDLHKLV